MALLLPRHDQGLRLNIGCGYKRQEGWVAVDAAPEVNPDVLWDCEHTPWFGVYGEYPDGARGQPGQLANGSVDEIAMIHSLEHMGRETGCFKRILQETYRVLKPGGIWVVVFPDVRHDHFWGDPTHVRPLTVQTFHMLSQKTNKEWIAKQWANTAYGLHIGVNFEIVDLKCLFDGRYANMPPDEAIDAATKYNNVVEEWRVALRKEPLSAD